MIEPTALRDIIRSGLLSFPVTPFDSEDRFNPTAFSAHLEWLSQHPVAGLIVAGGYSHSRLREQILGGVTRGLFERANIPVLFSH